MTREASDVEQAVSRTLRDSLERLQRTAEELNQAIGDLVSACASSRPSNSLPPMLRAQTSAASLAATLEVLSRFVTTSAQPRPRAAMEPEAEELAAATRAPSVPVPPLDSEPEPVIADSLPVIAGSLPVVADSLMDSQPPETVAELRSSDMVEEGAPIAPPFVQEPESSPIAFEAPPAFPEPAPAITDSVLESQPQETVAELQASDMIEEGAPAPSSLDVLPAVAEMPLPDPVPQSSSAVDDFPQGDTFDVSALSPEEQELHRRANRVAKVSMQDIKMLRPDDLKLGKENKDVCWRLRDDIEKAHKEYDRRFQTILDHPVDYFYVWMVEILGDGDAEVLGEYPYPSPVLRR